MRILCFSLFFYCGNSLNSSPVQLSLVSTRETQSGAWSVSDWTICSSRCGSGTQSRTVECRSVSDNSLLLDAACDSTGVDRPATTQDCSGECIDCPSSHGDWFRRSGFGSPASPAIFESNSEDLEYKLCTGPVGTSFPSASHPSCCTGNNEDAIRAHAVRLASAMDGVITSAPDVQKSISDSLDDFIHRMRKRISETETALAKMADAGSDPMNAVPIVIEVLQARKADLAASVAAAGRAASFLDQQAGVFNKQLADNSGEDTGFSRCAQAAVSLYANIACASCSPTFIDTYVDREANTAYISTLDCDTVYSACKGTISKSHSLLKQALVELRSVHFALSKAAMRLQPSLERVWKKLKFMWLPSSALPNDVNPKPDLTKLQCMKAGGAFSMPVINSENDFCGLYMSPYAAETFANRIGLTLQQGSKAMADLASCDGCLHSVLIRLPSLLVDGRATLEITLPSEEDAVNSCIQADGVQRSAQLMGLWESFDRERQRIREKKGRATLTGSLPSAAAASKLKALVTMTGASSAPVKIAFSDDGVDALGTGNFTSYQSLTNLQSILPPRSAWETRTDGLAPIALSDISCDDHSDCSPSSNSSAPGSPWWFCASTTACATTGACASAADASLLATGPKCARGQCRNGDQSIDGICPEEAVCPTTSWEGLGGPSYFAKFQRVVDEDPAKNGVCDCAFASASLSSAGLLAGEKVTVEDFCQQGLCAIYATIYEESAGCKQKLTDLCTLAQGKCPGLQCTSSGAVWNPPTCDAGRPIMMKSDSISGANAVGFGWVALGLVGIVFGVIW